MVRLRGRCQRGQRLIVKVPHALWTTSACVAALRSDALTAPCIFDGPTNGDCFKTYVERCLAPTLRPGAIVAMDDPGSHKSDDIQASIAARGASLRFLPAYAPDLNPIEMVCAKLEARLRKAAEHSVNALWHRVGALLDDLPKAECAAYLRVAGSRRRQASVSEGQSPAKRRCGGMSGASGPRIGAPAWASQLATSSAW